MSNFNPAEFAILMVDDVPKNLQVLGNTLSSEKYELEFALNGPHALELVGARDFDLILLDVMMPDMDGFEVCAKIRENEKYADTPVIFLTAKADKESILKGFEQGGQDYITKPFDSRELLVRVRTQIELADSRKKLKDINEYLGVKVEERTSQLKEANKKLEKQNQELDNMIKELSKLDSAKAEFLNIISHEIRTPLNGILGFLEVIKMSFDDDELQNYIQSMDASSKRLEAFLAQALMYSELRTHRRKPNYADCNISTLFHDEILPGYTKRIKQKELEIQFNLGGSDFYIMGDKKLISTCVTGIFDNSVEFSEQGGTIVITASEKAATKRLEFKDTGIGFSTKALENLFKPFSPGQEHIDLNEGLDLSIAYLIMEIHGGNISVSNNEDGGALVRLEFQANPEASSEKL